MRTLSKKTKQSRLKWKKFDYNKKLKINYVYFVIYFSSIVFIYIYYISITPATFWLKATCYSAAIIESSIESLALAWIVATFTKKNRFFFISFLSCIVILWYLRVVNFIMLRLVDVSIWECISRICHDTFQNLVELINSGCLSTPLIIFTTTIAITIYANIRVFYFTKKYAKKKVFPLSFRQLSCYCLVGFALLGTLGTCSYTKKTSRQSPYYANMLPWHVLFFPKKEEIIQVPNNLHLPKVESLNSINPKCFSLKHKPDIFLFIVESLRADFITEEIAPCLARFRDNNYSFPNALSNANATQNSWFSIFHSIYPFYWKKFASPQWNQGGVPLLWLKKMGYQIEVYSASNIEFYQMDQTLFGENRQLTNSTHPFFFTKSCLPADKDQLMIQSLCENLRSSKQKEGRLFLIFLDGTHFPYSWPIEHKKFFSPTHKNINSFGDPPFLFSMMKHIVSQSSPDLVKGYYKNSVHAVDNLFKNFQDTLIQLGKWKNAVIVFTGDHGEEFNESGTLLHGSHLNTPSLQVPLYFKLGKGFKGTISDNKRKASHVDIFPTLLHHLTGENPGNSYFQGSSLLAPSPQDYIVGVRSYSNLTPYQFFIQRGAYRTLLEFTQPNDIFHNRELKVHCILNEKDEEIPFAPIFFQEHFDPALNQLFPPQ